MKMISAAPPATSYFPFKLHRILDDAERDGFEEIISWMPGPVLACTKHNGSTSANDRGAYRDAFRVHKPKEFERLLMPRYFPFSNKYRSFQRNLNIWCFERVEKGPQKNAYHHPLFIRGQRSFCDQMVRVKTKNTTPNGLQQKSSSGTTNKNQEEDANCATKTGNASVDHPTAITTTPSISATSGIAEGQDASVAALSAESTIRSSVTMTILRHRGGRSRQATCDGTYGGISLAPSYSPPSSRSTSIKTNRPNTSASPGISIGDRSSDSFESSAIRNQRSRDIDGFGMASLHYEDANHGCSSSSSTRATSGFLRFEAAVDRAMELNDDRTRRSLYEYFILDEDTRISSAMDPPPAQDLVEEIEHHKDWFEVESQSHFRPSDDAQLHSIA
jgi:hypothetical protein